MTKKNKYYLLLILFCINILLKKYLFTQANIFLQNNQKYTNLTSAIKTICKNKKLNFIILLNDDTNNYNYLIDNKVLQLDKEISLHVLIKYSGLNYVIKTIDSNPTLIIGSYEQLYSIDANCDSKNKLDDERIVTILCINTLKALELKKYIKNLFGLNYGISVNNQTGELYLNKLAIIKQLLNTDIKFEDVLKEIKMWNTL